MHQMSGLQTDFQRSIEKNNLEASCGNVQPAPCSGQGKLQSSMILFGGFVQTSFEKSWRLNSFTLLSWKFWRKNKSWDDPREIFRKYVINYLSCVLSVYCCYSVVYFTLNYCYCTFTEMYCIAVGWGCIKVHAWKTWRGVMSDWDKLGAQEAPENFTPTRQMGDVLQERGLLLLPFLSAEQTEI